MLTKFRDTIWHRRFSLINTKQAANHCAFHEWKWLLISVRYPYTKSRFKHRSFHQYTYIRDGIIITSIQQTMFYYDNMEWSGDYNLSRPSGGCHDIPLWRHQMGTSSALVAVCAGNSPVTGEFPAQRPVTRSFEVFFDLRRNKRLSKQSWGWQFETPSRPLWRHRNAQHISHISMKLVKDS